MQKTINSTLNQKSKGVAKGLTLKQIDEFCNEYSDAIENEENENWVFEGVRNL